jgi:NACalpha-BTF3-like transcription factor
MGPLVMALGVQGLKKIKIKKKETNYVPNQPKAVLMEYEGVLHCLFFEPSVQLPVLLF